MKKVIEIDLNSKEDLLERYNNKKISKDLIEYLINETNFINKKDSIVIQINNNIKTDIDIIKYLTNGLKDEYESNIKSHLKNNIIQIILFFLGLFFLFLSTQINDNDIWKEMLLIGGWVPIWEMIDLELFDDFRGNKRKRIIQKLLDSEIIIN